MLAALMIHGIRPGPLLMQQHPEIFWGVIASMYVGNLMLLVLNLPLVGLFVQLLKVPYRVLWPLIIVITVVGSYSINSSGWDVFLMVAIGVVGYVLRKAGFELAPFALALILGPQLETSFRQSLVLSHGSPATFVTRPIAAGMLATFVAAGLGLVAWRMWSDGRAARGQPGRIEVGP
jgi:putative tricarboxylic transport membrane protein